MGIPAPKKILAIKIREIGDCVLLTAALRGLKAAYPEAEIHVGVPEIATPLFEGAPYVDAVHAVRTSFAGLTMDLWSFRKERFDLLLGFNATTSLCRLARLAGATATGLHHHSWNKVPRSSDLKVARPGNLEDAISRDRQLLEALGFRAAHEPLLAVSPVEKKWAQEELEKAGVRAPILAFLPGARLQTHRYPKDQWLQVLDQERLQRGRSLIVIADRKLSLEWRLGGECKLRKIALFDDLRLREFMAVISCCQMALTNDSGPLHIAAALGVKTLSLFGPGCLGDFHPYDPVKHRTLRIEIDCRNKGPEENDRFRYCTLAVCDHHSCLRKIPPAQVSQALHALEG